MATDSGRKLSSPGRKRRKAMIDAAYSLFTEKGYASVAVDDIIRISGGSKSSLYSFFGNKEGILKAVIQSLAEEMLEGMRMEVTAGQDPREALRKIGLRIATLALSENAINQYRLAVANAKNLPELATLWFESGPKSTFDGLAEYLRGEDAAGRLHIRNPTRAALFFFGMLIFKDNLAMSIGAPPPSRKELNEIVDEAVDVFLAAYGSGKRPSMG